MSTIQPFPMVERALVEILLRTLPNSTGRVDVVPRYVVGAEPFVWVQQDGGRAGKTEGDWVIDIDVLCDSYAKAMTTALTIESILLVGRLKAPAAGLLVDYVSENAAPRDLPWDDEAVWRVGATYVVSARRSG